MDHRPLVSIITATYNLSGHLAYAIRSVLRSTFTDWELLVVGDGCTDDTEAVVASFADPRIQFWNLSCNHGEQSAPNNAAFSRARGRFIAYLNHDDLWLPDHLEIALEGIARTKADLVFTLLLRVDGNGKKEIFNRTPDELYHPAWNVPASSWLLRRELLDEVGPWRSAWQIYDMPSQDWIFRAWKASKRLYLVPRLTVVALPSGARSGVYANRDTSEIEAYERRMLAKIDFREQELLVATPAAVDWGFGNAPMKTMAKVLLLSLGFRPFAAGKMLQYRRKGGFIRALRQQRGLSSQGR